MTAIINSLSIDQLEFLIDTYGSVVEWVEQAGNYVVQEDIFF